MVLLKDMAIAHLLLSVISFLTGLAASMYLFGWWARFRDAEHRFVLFWAGGLFLMYWFQVPAILASIGYVIASQNFNLMFTLTFPVTFLALILIYFGMLQISEASISIQVKRFIWGWFAFALFFFGIAFAVNGGVINGRTLPLVGNIAFYIPLRILIAASAVAMLRKPEFKNNLGKFAVFTILIEAFFGLIRNATIIKTVLSYSPEFWYPVLTNSQFFTVTQAASVIFFALGFFLLHAVYHGHRIEEARDSW